MTLDTSAHPFQVHTRDGIAHLSSLHAAASHLVLTKDKAGCVRLGEQRYLYVDAVRIAQEGSRLHAEALAQAMVRGR